MPNVREHKRDINSTRRGDDIRYKFYVIEPYYQYGTKEWHFFIKNRYGTIKYNGYADNKKQMIELAERWINHESVKKYK